MGKVCKISVFLSVIAVMLISSLAYAGKTERVSISSDGVQGNYESGTFSDPSISADGRFIAFESVSNNLVLGDTNGDSSWIWGGKDIFVYDRQAGITERVSVSSDGEQGNNWSESPSISADGRFVVFESTASNLVPGDTNNRSDIFVHDRQTSKTERVSITSDGMQAVGYDYGSRRPFISSDGRFVTFSSDSYNLVSGDTNYNWDVFIHDRQTGKTERVSVSSDGMESNYKEDSEICLSSCVSADGRFVAFSSAASNLVSGDTNGDYGNYWKSGNDIFVHDMQNGKTKRVSVSSDGEQGNGSSMGLSISSDGRYIAFYSYASNLIPCDTNGRMDTFVHDRQTGITERVSISSDGVQGNEQSYYSSISADGRFISFSSEADNLVISDTNGVADIFVHDMQTGKTQRVTTSNDIVQANDKSCSLSISADGRFVAFSSYADNLVSGDTNGCKDIFVHELTGIKGKVVLSDFKGDITRVPVTVDLGNGIDPIELTLDPDGTFFIWDPPCGTFDIRIKASHWLTKTIPGVVVN